MASRILPVNIHDLDMEDNVLLEIELGAVPRGIEFIYKSAGVNRPLRSKEDNPLENLNHSFYRDQINKVALAVKEIIESMKISYTPEKIEEKLISVKKRIEKRKRLKDDINSNKEL